MKCALAPEGSLTSAQVSRPMNVSYNPVMRRPLLAAAALIGMLVISSSSLLWAQAKQDKDALAPETAPDVPDAITTPPGLEPVLFVRAKGSQIYTCKADADGKFSWTLKGPDAELKDRKDKVIGQHTAGPTWKLKDGSEVTGKAAAHVDALDSDSIPWLLVDVVTNSGKGALAKVTKIQRVHTHGGKPGNDPCDDSHKDAETKSDYTADYYFFAPAK
jgi:hypothetical protein